MSERCTCCRAELPPLNGAEENDFGVHCDFCAEGNCAYCFDCSEQS